MTVSVCGFTAGRQDNWIITQHISRMINGTALQQVTVQVDFIIHNYCDILNNCSQSFAIYKYETSTINTTSARNLNNYEFVGRIVPRDGSGTVRENGSVNINFDTEETGFYLGIQDETTCIVIHRVLVFYYVCPAVTSDLITRPETTAPIIGGTAPPAQVVGQCVENASPENGVHPGLTCSQRGVWSVNIGTACVCNPGFQSTSDGRSCEGMLSVYLSAFLFLLHLSSHPVQPVMLGHMEQVAAASPVLPTVTAHRVGHLCVLALRGTTELLGNLQKWNVLVSLMMGVELIQCIHVSVCHAVYPLSTSVSMRRAMLCDFWDLKLSLTQCYSHGHARR